jgi:mannose-6-phosphate isomerase-like protein (cupin superfamily)
MFCENIDEIAERNDSFRRVIHTGKFSQVVLMSLLPGEEIGEETHPAIDQIFLVVEGRGRALIGGRASVIREDDLFVVPAGVRHNVENVGNADLKLCTIYSPPAHAPGTIHETREEATREEEALVE